MNAPLRVLLAGATGTIGRATALALAARGHRVVALVRQASASAAPSSAGIELRRAEVLDPRALARDALRGERFDVLVSCLASRSGAPRDAWAVDHRAQVQLLEAARAAGVQHVLLLSAICLQKPRLAFQHAKLAFERVLADSGVPHAVVRPTAYFKSLAGQVARVAAGKPYLVFGDGRLTACKPISDRDLAAYLADCVEQRRTGVLPIGGPGPAITPLDQAEHLFALLRRPPRIRRVPLGLMDGIVGALSLAGRVWPAAADKAEFARIGRYYASESMLVWDAAAGRYDADATPSTGSDRYADHVADLLAGRARTERGEHAVF